MKVRRINFLVVAIAMLCSCLAMTVSASAEALTNFLWGDVNRDAIVSVEDAQQVLIRYVHELAENYDDMPGNWAAADVDNNGKLSVEDAQLILIKYVTVSVAGLNYFFPVESPIGYDEDIYVKKDISVYRLPSMEEDYLIGRVKSGTTFKILQYMGKDWYRFESDNFISSYMCIPQDMWKVDVLYKIDYDKQQSSAAAETTTTTSTTTTAVSTTTSTPVTTTSVTSKSGAPVTTGTTVATTVASTTVNNATTTMKKETTSAATTTTTTTTAAYTTTSTAKTTTTMTGLTTTVTQVTTISETTAPTQTTIPEETTSRQPKYAAKDVIEFKATAYKLYDAIAENQVKYLQSHERFTILEAKALENGDQYLVEFNNRRYYIYISEADYRHFLRLN